MYLFLLPKHSKEVIQVEPKQRKDMNSDKKRVWKKMALAYSISACRLLESRDSVTIMKVNSPYKDEFY